MSQGGSIKSGTQVLDQSQAQQDQLNKSQSSLTSAEISHSTKQVNFSKQDISQEMESKSSLGQMSKKNKSKAHKVIIPPSEGKFIKTADTLRKKPCDFLRIGKVQKEQDEPLTEAQVKHRDRSYIISKLNKNIQKMQVDETTAK